MKRLGLLLASLILTSSAAATAQTRDDNVPHLRSQGGRHALIVDGRPFLMLGAQAHNSSNYPAMLPKVWPTLRALRANTLEIPIAWEQVEPVEGKFNFSFVDQLVKE